MDHTRDDLGAIALLTGSGTYVIYLEELLTFRHGDTHNAPLTVAPLSAETEMILRILCEVRNEM